MIVDRTPTRLRLWYAARKFQEIRYNEFVESCKVGEPVMHSLGYQFSFSGGRMSVKIDFLVKAIEEVQETNRFLDTKAGVVVIFESSLLAILLSGLIDKTVLEHIYYLQTNSPKGYFIFLVVFAVVYILGLIVHILLTLKVIFPSESVEDHVDISDFEPRRLFYLYELNKKDVIQPSLVDYAENLAEMTTDEIIKEYIFELLKLSYIRKKKRDRLAFSLKYLGVLILCLVFFGILVGLSL